MPASAAGCVRREWGALLPSRLCMFVWKCVESVCRMAQGCGPCVCGFYALYSGGCLYTAELTLSFIVVWVGAEIAAQ